jgi:hypothetical protein
MKEGHIGIFEREKEKRKSKDVYLRSHKNARTTEFFHINELHGPSMTGIFKENEEIHNHVWDEVWGTFEKRVLHELHFILDHKEKK